MRNCTFSLLLAHDANSPCTSRSRGLSARALYIHGINHQSSKRELEDRFKAHGTVVAVHIPTNPATGTTRGFGFVRMSTPEEADRAIEEEDRKMFMGVAISVERAKRFDKNSRRPYTRGVPYPVRGGYDRPRGASGPPRAYEPRRYPAYDERRPMQRSRELSPPPYDRAPPAPRGDYPPPARAGGRGDYGPPPAGYRDYDRYGPPAGERPYYPPVGRDYGPPSHGGHGGPPPAPYQQPHSRGGYYEPPPPRGDSRGAPYAAPAPYEYERRVPPQAALYRRDDRAAPPPRYPPVEGRAGFSGGPPPPGPYYPGPPRYDDRPAPAAGFEYRRGPGGPPPPPSHVTTGGPNGGRAPYGTPPGSRGRSPPPPPPRY